MPWLLYQLVLHGSCEALGVSHNMHISVLQGVRVIFICMQKGTKLETNSALQAAADPLETLTAAGFPEAAAREALQRAQAGGATGPNPGSGAPHRNPGGQILSVLQRAAELLAAQHMQPDAHALARMLAAAAAAPGRSEPDQAVGGSDGQGDSGCGGAGSASKSR